MRYRPDVDGLRAIAVILVIVYHMGLLLPGGRISGEDGGFVGVDIFFVISGYLITGIVHRKIASGTFTFADFYARRVRRILPAFYTVLICTTCFLLPHLFPVELIAYAKSATAALLSVANIYFWATTNYFAAPATTQPLLHTWSLGVEEQFYMFWPLLLLLVERYWHSKLRTIILAVAAVSFALSAYGVYAWPEATFYLLFTRMWELAIGGMLALKVVPCPSARWAREAAGIFGLALIAVSELTFRASMPFPGVAALAPVAGTALIIAGGEHGPSFVGRCLSFRPLVFVGLISYSLYLWHWPILVCQAMYSIFPGGAIGKAVKLEVLTLTVILSILSWRFVEQPFRHHRWSNRSTISFAIAFSLLLLVSGKIAISASAAQFSKPELGIASYLSYLESHPALEGCQVMEGETASAKLLKPCLALDPAKKNYLVLVDSQANHLFPGLVAAYPNVHFVRATGSGCELVLPGEHFKKHCDSLFSYLYRSFFPVSRIDGIILESRWDMQRVPEILEFVNWAHGHGYPVLVLGPIPQYDSPLPRLIAEGMQRRDPSYVERHRIPSDEFDKQMAALAVRNQFEYISWTELLCSQGHCPIETPDGVPLVYDYGHLTLEGSRYIAEKLRDSGTLSLAEGL